MKLNLNKTIFTILLIFICQLSMAQWKVIDIVDDFGDKVGEVTSFIGKGKFSNSAAMNEDLTIKVSYYPNDEKEMEKFNSYETFKVYYDNLLKDSEQSLRDFALKDSRLKKTYEEQKSEAENTLGKFIITLYEYDRSPVSFLNEYNDTDIMIKTENGEIIKHKIEKSKYSKTQQYLIFRGKVYDDSGKIFNSILDSSPVRVVIKHRNSTYNFEVDGYSL